MADTSSTRHGWPLLSSRPHVGEMTGVWTDGGGGTVISESDDIEAAYRNLLNYARFMEFDTKVVLPAEQAVVQTLDFLG